ncbi:MAG TPA: hypothetical protein PKV41_03570, partial [Candidatus Omnitrophota bacterium]|nr:hypothetical protein [Candidatus Omnitrophota bacterium]
MKKVLLFFRIYWVKVLILIVILAALGFAIYGMVLGFQSFNAMEPFSRRMLMGQMALFGVMFLMVQLIATPLAIFLQMFFMQGGLTKLFSTKITKSKVNVKWD